jgi:NAD+ diphosphatase
MEIENLILLGRLNGTVYFACALDAENGRAESGVSLSDFEDLRKVGPLLDDHEATLLAYAKSLCHWHERHRFCGACGSPTVAGRAGHVRVCQNAQCGASHFPRIDPAIIVLVHCHDHCLLGRQSRWPKKRYSTIAGFVEPGESAEHAVLREVFEETGIRLEHLSYQSSQPWPFPGSLMLGFHAETARQEICRNDEELEDARWFSRQEVARAIEGRGDIRLPPRMSISRRLIEDWCHN